MEDFNQYYLVFQHLREPLLKEIRASLSHWQRNYPHCHHILSKEMTMIGCPSHPAEKGGWEAVTFAGLKILN